MKKYYKIIIFLAGLVVGMILLETLSIHSNILMWGIGVIVGVVGLVTLYVKNKKKLPLITLVPLK